MSRRVVIWQSENCNVAIGAEQQKNEVWSVVCVCDVSHVLTAQTSTHPKISGTYGAALVRLVREKTPKYYRRVGLVLWDK